MKCGGARETPWLYLLHTGASDFMGKCKGANMKDREGPAEELQI